MKSIILTITVLLGLLLVPAIEMKRKSCHKRPTVGMTGCKLPDGSTIGVGETSPPAPVCGQCLKCGNDGNLQATTCLECIEGQNRMCELVPTSGLHFCICIPSYDDVDEDGICTEDIP